MVEHQPHLYQVHLTELESPAGQRLAASMTDAWAERCAVLLSAFEPQAHPAWCALASTVVAWRALGLSSVPTQQSLCNYYTAMFGGECRGISLTQLEVMLQTFAADANASLRVHCCAGDVADELLVSLLGDLESEGSFVLVNFLRQLNGSWTGHWSVIAGIACDADGTDKHALVLDVAAHKIGPHWVALPLIVACMATRNHLNQSRGYIRLSCR